MSQLPRPELVQQCSFGWLGSSCLRDKIIRKNKSQNNSTTTAVAAAVSRVLIFTGFEKYWRREEWWCQPNTFSWPPSASPAPSSSFTGSSTSSLWRGRPSRWQISVFMLPIETNQCSRFVLRQSDDEDDGWYVMMICSRLRRRQGKERTSPRSGSVRVQASAFNASPAWDICRLDVLTLINHFFRPTMCAFYQVSIPCHKTVELSSWWILKTWYLM